MEKLGSLPSMEAYQRMLDAPSSYHSRLYENNHQLDPFLNWQVKGLKGIWSGQFRMPVSYKTRTLRYHRGEVDTTFTKRTILVKYLRLLMQIGKATTKERVPNIIRCKF